MKVLKETKYKNYTNGIETIRVYDGEEPPEGYWHGRTFNANPWNKGLTKEDPRVAANLEAGRKTYVTSNHTPWNKGLKASEDERVRRNVEYAKETIRNKYGVDNISQYISKQPDYQIWNKGLTKETDDRMKKASENHKGVAAWNKDQHIEGHPHTQETKDRLSKIHLDPEFKNKRYIKMKENGTLYVKDSKAESEYYKKLIDKYGEENIIRQYFDKDRYPFKCDFYIPSEDLFIEVHGNWTHGGRPFDQNDVECMDKLALWKEKAETSDYYKNAIYTWTNLDVRKLETANKNNLNFQVIYY